MIQFDIFPTWEIDVCPIGHKDLCAKKWKNRHLEHYISCICKCHMNKKE